MENSLGDTELLYDKLVVIIKTKNGDLYQVALDQEMCDSLYSDLKMYYKDDKVKIIPNKIEGFVIE